MKLNKYTITTFIFLSFIFFIGVITIWNNKAVILKLLDSDEPINEINMIYSENLAYSDEFIEIWSKTQALSKSQILDDAEYGVIVKDGEGSLYFPADDVDVSTYAMEAVQFSNLLKEKNVPFIYIQAPNKYLKGYTDDIVTEYNYSNKNADEFLNILRSNEVNTLDLRESILKSGLETSKLFYRTDHHWTTETAFWAYGEIVSFLNENHNLAINSDFYADINNYNKELIKECYLGSLGRRVGEAVAGLDDYVFIEPKFETNYKIYDGNISKETPVFSGNFREAIVKEEILESKDVTSNKHASYFEWDYGNLIINNTLIDNDVKILLIKDSYSLPVAAFLSTCVKELHMVDLRDASPVNLKEYVTENDFDVVITMYNTEVFNDTMFDFM